VNAPWYLGVFDRLNGFVTSVLASRLHWPLSFILMLATVTGRRTGRRYTIPVAYHEIDGAIIVLVSDAANRTWWRNYREAGPIELRIRGRVVSARARVLAPTSDEFRRRAEQVFGRMGFIARIFGLRFDPTEGLTPEQTRALAAYAVVVLIKPDLGSGVEPAARRSGPGGP
jgi:deazaflavin-dependent oxidoreductase (nitroreductase family)